MLLCKKNGVITFNKTKSRHLTKNRMFSKQEVHSMMYPCDRSMFFFENVLRKYLC